MTTQTIEEPEARLPVPKAELERFRVDAQGLVSMATAIEVRDQESYEAAVGYVNQANAKDKGVEAFFKRYMNPLKGILDGMRKDRDAILIGDRVRALVDPKVRAWRKAEQERQAEAQRKAEEAARREADRVQKANMKKAEKAEKQGDLARAEELRQPVAPAPVLAQTAVPAGSNKAKAQIRWKFEIADPKALPREYLIPDESAIRKVVDALKDRTQIAGVRVWSEETMSYGSQG